MKIDSDLGNIVFRKLGFSAHAKVRALKMLVEAKMVTVQWRGRKTPLVKFKRPYSL
jgi:hypothetical protein